MARILLTGAAGFVGRALLARPAAGCHTWMALDLGFPEAWMPGAHVTESVATDLSDPVFLRQVVARFRPEAVVHLAGWTGKGGSVENRAKLLAANVTSTWNVLDAVAAAHLVTAPRFVLASSALVYGDQPGPFREGMGTRPADEYAISKLLAEELVSAAMRRGAVRATILRPAVIYGPGQGGGMFVPSLVRSLVAGERFAMTAGEQTRDLLHVRDAADAFLATIEGGADGVFNVGTGEGVAMAVIGRTLAGMTGHPELLGIGDLAYRENEVWTYAVDASRLEIATGWKAQVRLTEGLQETLDKEKYP